MRCLFTRLLLVAAWTLLSGNAQAGILNGEFSVAGSPPAPFANWETDLSFGAPPADASEIAEFTARDFFEDQQLQQWLFAFPNNAATLSFEFQLETSPGGTTSPGAPPDSFQASLYDSVFNPLFPSNPAAPGLFPAFFSVDNDGPQFFDPAVVSVQNIGGSWNRVSLDVSSLNISSLPSDELLIEFLALGSDDGLETTVLVDNVELVIPEPASLLVWSAGACAGGVFLRKRRHRAGAAAA